MKTRFISEYWLREMGFKPHWFAGQPNQHWLLWLNEDRDLGIELSFGRENPEPWFYCWLRSGGDHTHDRFIHVRYMTSKHEVISLVQAVTGRRWNPKTHTHGVALAPRYARRERRG